MNKPTPEEIVAAVENYAKILADLAPSSPTVVTVAVVTQLRELLTGTGSGRGKGGAS